MKKLEYKQPRIDVDVLSSKSSLMDPVVMAGSPDGPGVGSAPKRRGEVIE